MALDTTAMNKGDVGSQAQASGQVAGDCMTTFSTGPGTLLYTIMNAVMAMCGKIQKAAAKAAELQIKLGLKQNQNAQFATVAAGDNEKAKYMMSAEQSFAGAGVTFTQMVATSNKNEALSKEATAEGETHSKLKTLDEINHQNLKELTAGDPMPPRAPNADSAKEDEIQSRKAALCKSFGTDDTSKTYDNAGKVENLDQDAIDAMNATEHANFKKGLGQRIKASEKRSSRISSDIQNNFNKYKMYADLASGVKDGAFNVAQGINSATKAQNDADATRAQYGVQVAQTNEGVASSQLSDWYKKIEAVVAAMSQGSKAYSQ